MIIDAVLTINNISVSFGSGIDGEMISYPRSTFQIVTTTLDPTQEHGHVHQQRHRKFNFLAHAATQPFNYTFDPATDNLPTSGIGGEFRMASNPAGDSSAVM